MIGIAPIDANAQWQTIRADFSGVSRYKEALPITKPEIIDLADYKRKDVECLAWTIYFEARGTKVIEQAAVAWVAINRTVDSSFSTDLCTNIFQYNIVNGSKHYQFSWASRRPSKNINKDEWNIAQNLAIMVYTGDIPDPTNGATYFRNRTDRNWAPRPTKVHIGSHIFWKM
jgi:spore germination cell wall hydrolase CwlJ-like protein